MSWANFFAMPDPVPILDDTLRIANARVVTDFVPMSGSDRALWPYQTRVCFLDPWSFTDERMWSGWWASKSMFEAETKHYEVVASLARRKGRPWDLISADTIRVRDLDLDGLFSLDPTDFVRRQIEGGGM